MREQKSDHTASEHLFEYRDVHQKKLTLSLVITAVVMVVEFIGGFITNSIALISDAGHMFTHSFALTIALVALIIAKKPPCHHRTYGLYRAEILAAFVNGLFLLVVVGIIIYEAVLRLINPLQIYGLEMLAIALIGLITNIISISILRGAHKENLNIKGVFYHMIADALSSVGIVIAALLIMFVGWTFVDPLVSIGISLVILVWAYGILKDSTRVLLEMAPSGLDGEILSEDLKKSFPEIRELHNVHLWSITPDMLVFSAHVQLDTNNLNMSSEALIAKINDYLTTKYSIIECTLQLCTDEGADVCHITP